MKVMVQEVSDGSASYNSYGASDVMVDMACAGNSSGTAAKIPNAPGVFNRRVDVRYVDASNLAVMLPGDGGAFIEVHAYWHGSGTPPAASITLYLPMIAGVQSKFYDGSTSISIPIGTSKRFRQKGTDFLTSTPYWVRS